MSGHKGISKKLPFTNMKSNQLNYLEGTLLGPSSNLGELLGGRLNEKLTEGSGGAVPVFQVKLHNQPAKIEQKPKFRNYINVNTTKKSPSRDLVDRKVSKVGSLTQRMQNQPNSSILSRQPNSKPLFQITLNLAPSI